MRFVTIKELRSSTAASRHRPYRIPRRISPGLQLAMPGGPAEVL